MITFTPYASGSSGNLYTVSDGITTIMLDCGIPWRKVREALNFKTSEVAGILLTHLHQDHIKGANEAARQGMDIYASKETITAVNGPEYHNNVVSDGQLFRIGTWRIRAFSTVHDTLGAFGYYMMNKDGEAFLYLTDSMYAPVRFAGLKVISIECNFVSEILTNNIFSGAMPAKVGHRTRRTHFSQESVIEFLKANDLSNCAAIHLLHLSDRNSDEARMIRAVQEATGIPCRAAQ